MREVTIETHKSVAKIIHRGLADTLFYYRISNHGDSGLYVEAATNDQQIRYYHCPGDDGSNPHGNPKKLNAMLRAPFTDESLPTMTYRDWYVRGPFVDRASGLMSSSCELSCISYDRKGFRLNTQNHTDTDPDESYQKLAHLAVLFITSNGAPSNYDLNSEF